MFEKLARQLNIRNKQNQGSGMTSPFDAGSCEEKNSILRKLSKQALDLYQKKTDIKNFTKLALSDPQDSSHNELVKEKQLDEYDILFDLSNNDEFLKDLGL